MDRIEKMLSEMSTREKVYQTMIQRSEGYIYDDEAEAKLKESPFGGFFVGEEIIGSKVLHIGYAEKVYYKKKREWSKMVERAMKADFSWDISANKYQEMYDWLIG